MLARDSKVLPTTLPSSREWGIERAGYSCSVLGEQDALVLEVRPFDLHGVTYVDVKVAFRDRSVHEARLGPESVPERLEPGEQVVAMTAANMIVSLRRAEPR
jgi:hypothetical protein